MRREYAIRTIGDFLKHGMGLCVSCEGCRAREATMVEIDLIAVGERIGRDHDLYRRDRFNRMLPMVCSRCGSRKLSWIVLSPAPAPNHSTWGGQRA